jgi:hypothetical protein
MRWWLVVVLAGCGRIGFETDRTATPDDAAVDAPFACAGPAIATEPPTSGGGFTLVRGFGLAPNAPTGPTTDTIQLAWLPRTLPAGGSYAVVRTVCGTGVDVTTTDTARTPLHRHRPRASATRS